MVNNLGYHTFQFWKAAIPYVFDSDMQHGTKYRDALIFTMALYDVNTGRGGMRYIILLLKCIKIKFRSLYAAVPGLRKCLLGVRAKRFGEQYHHMQQRRRSASKSSLLKSSNGSLTGIEGEFTESNLIAFDLGVTRNEESENDECNNFIQNFKD